MVQNMTGSELIINRQTGSLYHINLSRRDGFPHRFLLVGDPNRVREAAKFFDGGRVCGEKSNREYVSVWGKYHGVPVSVMGTGIGTDNTEIAVVEMHAVHEFEFDSNRWQDQDRKLALIRVGTSGSPQRDIRLGTLAVTEHAIGLDNTGVYYLHMPLRNYPDQSAVFYTPGDHAAAQLWKTMVGAFNEVIPHIVAPYVSSATKQVAQSLITEARAINSKCGDLATLPVELGITTSAPGFFGPQGRRVGRLGNVLIPDFQERLATIGVKIEPTSNTTAALLRVTNNEMESSALFRIAGEILGYNVGTICLVIANRAEGEFITPELYDMGVRRALEVAFESISKLD